MAQTTVSQKGRPINIFDDLEELTSGEILYFGQKTKALFEVTLSKDSHDIHWSKSQGAVRIVHIFTRDKTEGYVFAECRGVVIIGKVREDYVRRGAEIIREYAFHDKAEAGFMWRGQILPEGVGQ